MKLLKIYEKAWIVAIVVAVIISVVNWVRIQAFTQAVYFPLVIAFFCLIVYLTKRNHRRFLEKVKQSKQDSAI